MNLIPSLPKKYWQTVFCIVGAMFLSCEACYAVDMPLYQPFFVGPLATQPTVPAGLNVAVKGAETLSWDSNPLMVSGSSKSLFGSTTAPELIFNDSTPTSYITSDTVVDENLFNQSAFNSTDVHESAQFNTQTQQWAGGMIAKFDYDTVRTSELTTFGVNIPDIQHTGFMVVPQISYSPTEVDKFSVSGTASRSIYDNAAYTDYNLFSVNPAYSHNFDPNNTGVFTLNAQRYEATVSDGITVDTIGPTVGWTTLFTPRFTAKFNVGVERSLQSSAGNTAGDDTWNYVFGTDFSYKGDKDIADLTATRSEYPFENGTETLLTSFGISESHSINPLISLNASASYALASTPPSATGINLNSQIMASAGIAYHLLSDLDITANYQYRDETLTDGGGTVRDNAALISLIYHPFTKSFQ